MNYERIQYRRFSIEMKDGITLAKVWARIADPVQAIAQRGKGHTPSSDGYQRAGKSKGKGRGNGNGK